MSAQISRATKRFRHRMISALVRPSALDVGDRRLVEPHPDHHGAVERGVGLAVPAAVRRCLVVLPDDAGMGATQRSFAHAASLRIRSGSSGDDQHLGGRVGGDPEGIEQLGSQGPGERLEPPPRGP
jgi:hypothetical protein